MEPDLRLVPIKSIDLQEELDRTRLGALVTAFKQSGILKDPPIVAKGLGGKLTQLDGTTRISALKELGASHVVVQVVDYSDVSQVDIKSWVHVSRVKKGGFAGKIKALEGARTEEFKVGLGTTLIDHPSVVAAIIFRDGRGLNVYNRAKQGLLGRRRRPSGEGDLFERVALLRRVVRLYEESITRDEQETIDSMEELEDFFARHKDKNVALFFPSFSTQEIGTLLKKGVTLPAGITRHVINGRVLRINYPLEMLSLEKPDEDKLRYFDDFIKNVGLRFYEEPTFIAD
ncbi:MAG: hypothetical protein BMS9Abin34_210 [Patescibacteria group bacterium]|nr:MAG: hypothetical protein BMS9Abin34_210 [Patescibacteria group bacterium]